MALCAAIAAACSAASAPSIGLDTRPHFPVVTVSGLSWRDMSALTSATLSREAWQSILRVSVKTADGAAPLPMAGSYDVSNGVIRFTPIVPLEPGRPYEVTFSPAALPGGTLAHLPPVVRVLSVPAPPPSPPTSVTGVYPTGPEVPANLLRMYVEFSGPMGIRTGEPYITVLDGDGRDIAGALLPLDTDLWNPEHTRFTILFDPGRVKRGILPNRAMGRPLHPGDTFTVAIKREWPDAQGRPLASEFRKTYRVAPAIERPLSPSDWRFNAPRSGSRDWLVVTFGAGLDRALLERALSVERGSQALHGTIIVKAGEAQVSFAPQVAWPPGDYTLVVQPELEDPAGNRIGRAFEARDPADDTRQPPARVPFTVR
jgi:hypothetical protein